MGTSNLCLLAKEAFVGPGPMIRLLCVLAAKVRIKNIKIKCCLRNVWLAKIVFDKSLRLRGTEFFAKEQWNRI